MAQIAKLRRHKLIASAKLHATLDAEQYGKLLYLKNKDYIDRLLISYGLFPNDMEAEKLCGDLFKNLWKSIGRCIRHDVEVRVGKNSRLGNQLFTIVYAKRDSVRAQGHVGANKKP